MSRMSNKWCFNMCCHSAGFIMSRFVLLWVTGGNIMSSSNYISQQFLLWVGLWVGLAWQHPRGKHQCPSLEQGWGMAKPKGKASMPQPWTRLGGREGEEGAGGTNPSTRWAKASKTISIWQPSRSQSRPATEPQNAPRSPSASKRSKDYE